MCSFSLFQNGDWKLTGQSDKATLHQSAIELRGSTVGEPVGVFSPGCGVHNLYVGKIIILLIFFQSVLDNSDATFFLLFSVYSLLRSCLKQVLLLLYCYFLRLMK